MEVQQISNTVQASTPQTGNDGARSAVDFVKPAAASVAVSANAVQSPAPATDSAQVRQAVKSLNETVQAFTRDLEFTVDEDTKKTLVKVVDVNTNEVIRQIPSEEVLAIAKALDKLQGLIIRQKA